MLQWPGLQVSNLLLEICAYKLQQCPGTWILSHRVKVPQNWSLHTSLVRDQNSPTPKWNVCLVCIGYWITWRHTIGRNALFSSGYLTSKMIQQKHLMKNQRWKHLLRSKEASWSNRRGRLEPRMKVGYMYWPFYVWTGEAREGQCSWNSYTNNPPPPSVYNHYTCTRNHWVCST